VAPAPVAPAPPALDRRLVDAASWNEHLARISNDCVQRPLDFALGGGVLVRARMSHVHVPDDFPIIGGTMEAPAVSTGFKRIVTRNGNSTSLQDMFPQWLCEGGVCTGSLPGCQSDENQNWHFNLLRLNFSGGLYYSDNPGRTVGFIQAVLAYAFSLFPDMVEVFLHSTDSTSTVSPLAELTATLSPATTTAPAVTPAVPPASLTVTTTACPEPEGGDATAVLAYVQCLQASCQNANHNYYPCPVTPDATCQQTSLAELCPLVCEHGGCPASVGQRRLEDSGPAAQTWHATVRFKQGLPYELDDASFRRLLDSGAIEGSKFISAFSVEPDSQETDGVPPQFHEIQQEYSASNRGIRQEDGASSSVLSKVRRGAATPAGAVLLGMVACTGVVLWLALASAKLRRRGDFKALAVQETADHEAGGE